MLPTLNSYARSQSMPIQLGGLNLTETLADGDQYRAMEWSWTQNMDTAMSPIIRRREKRIKVGQLTKPNGICALQKLAFIDGKTFYWNGYNYGTLPGPDNVWRTMVPMGSDICIFPDKVIFSTNPDVLDFRNMEQTNTISTGDVIISLAQADGSSWGSYTASATAPDNPLNGEHWLDTGESPAVMKTWSEYTEMWVDEYTTNVKIAADGIGTGLSVDDAVEVSGLSVEALNGTWQLLAVDPDGDWISYTGVITAETTQTATASEPVTVKRACPDMDFVIEHNNRLWGCNSQAHEIYACALGDATNWRQYAGISTDSYAVTVGSPGPFTGTAVVNSSVCFFKEDCIHKIYGTMPSNFQMTVDHYRGVEQGSGKSVVRINELVYYKSVFDICAYNGTEVAGISDALGVKTWKNAVAGKNDRRLYVSMQDDAGTWHLLTCDTDTGLWMREDGTHALGFAHCLTETFMLTADGGLWALRTAEYAKQDFLEYSQYTMIGAQDAYGAVEETDAQVPWLLRSGEIMSRLPNNKRLGKIQILTDLGQDSTMTVRIKKDNENWETVFQVTAGDERRYTLPIYPRRCDRLTIELSGTGPVKIYNLSWLIESGSEYGRA